VQVSACFTGAKDPPQSLSFSELFLVGIRDIYLDLRSMGP
jgi:hypothetical protein